MALGKRLAKPGYSCAPQPPELERDPRQGLELETWGAPADSLRELEDLPEATTHPCPAGEACGQDGPGSNSANWRLTESPWGTTSTQPQPICTHMTAQPPNRPWLQRGQDPQPLHDHAHCNLQTLLWPRMLSLLWLPASTCPTHLW